MNSLIKNFDNYSSEYLLGRRALGEQLSGEAHQAIEEILNERGVNFPALPKLSIDVTKENFNSEVKRQSKFYQNLSFIALVLFLMAINILTNAIPHTTFGIVSLILFIVYFIFNYIRKANLCKEKQEEEKKVKKIQDDEVSDLMLASAEGNLERVTDLVAYGANVNATSYNGSTSLMYAARNNRLSIVKFLIENGADREVKNEKKSTALSLSETFKSNEVNEYLKSLSSKR